MKITKTRLKEIIKEEVEKVLKEGLEDSEAGSRHYQNVKRKERILKKAIKDGLTFDQVQDKYTEFYDLDPEYYKHLKTEKPSEALEEAELGETMDSGYMPPPKEKPKKKSKLKEELPMQDDALDLPPGAVEVTDVEEKVKNFLSTKSYTKAGMDDAARAEFARSLHNNFTQFILDGEIYHIYNDMMVNSEDQEVYPDNPKEVRGATVSGPAKGTLTSYNPDGSVKSMRSTGGYVAENIYSKQANMPLEDEADDIIADAGADDIMSLLDGLPPDEKLEIINMLMGDLYQTNPELADEFDRMKGPS